MNIARMIEGLQILQKYSKDHGYCIGAEHDQFYVYATERPVERADVEQLVALDWFQEDADYDQGNGFTADDYDAEKSWTAYV